MVCEMAAFFPTQSSPGGLRWLCTNAKQPNSIVLLSNWNERNSQDSERGDILNLSYSRKGMFVPQGGENTYQHSFNNAESQLLSAGSQVFAH